MKVSEAIQIQKEYVANKYHILRFPNKTLKESMRTLTNAYDELWEYLLSEHQDILNEFLKKGE